MILIVISRHRRYDDVFVKIRISILRRLRFDFFSIQSNRSIHGRWSFGIVISLYVIIGFIGATISTSADNNVFVIAATGNRAWVIIVAICIVNIRVLCRLITVRCSCMWRSYGNVIRIIFNLSRVIFTIDRRIAILENNFRILHGYVFIWRSTQTGLLAGIEGEMRLVFWRTLRTVKRWGVAESLVTRERSICYDPAKYFYYTFLFLPDKK